MAAPVPVTALYTTGKSFVATWSGVWAGTGDFTANSVVVDQSALPYTKRMRIFKIIITATTGISARLHFDDASSDQEICLQPLANTGPLVLDFTSIGGLQRNAHIDTTDTGDVVLTTLSAASGDAISITVIGKSA
jgi:hypothetical protein